MIDNGPLSLHMRILKELRVEAVHHHFFPTVLKCVYGRRTYVRYSIVRENALIY